MSIHKNRRFISAMTAAAAVLTLGLASGASAQTTSSTTTTVASPSSTTTTVVSTSSTTPSSTTPSSTTAPGSTTTTTSTPAAMLTPKSGTAAIVAGEGRTVSADGTVTPAKIIDAVAGNNILRVEGTSTFKMDIGVSGDVSAATSGTGVVLSMKAGGTVTVRVLGLKPSSTADVWVASNPVKIATLSADATGVASGVVTIPASLSNGTHTLQIQGTESTTGALQAIAYGFTATGGAASGSTTTTVSAGTNLPSSGPSTTTVAIIAATLLGALGIWSRRRTA